MLLQGHRLGGKLACYNQKKNKLERGRGGEGTLSADEAGVDLTLHSLEIR